MEGRQVWQASQRLFSAHGDQPLVGIRFTIDKKKKKKNTGNLPMSSVAEICVPTVKPSLGRRKKVDSEIGRVDD